MKTAFTLTFCLLLANIASYAQPATTLANPTHTKHLTQHLQTVQQTKADKTTKLSATPPQTLQALTRAQLGQHFPYPIIFVHGLASSADTWTDFYDAALTQGWSYGGHLRFNLNQDDNLGYSNIYSETETDFEDFNTDVPAADFYLVNFNVGTDGLSYGENYNPTQSNQAAITKQGLAIRNAITEVLQATGKDKVILFGHSMGGLASRQYLQNETLWQADGRHHVAKLVTTGTPHGGSNASGSFLGDAFVSLDEGSDAIRDLRTSYFYSGDDGVFLFGGLESNNVMNDTFFGFYNYDVSCNGVQGEQVTGLNQKNIPTNLDYTCIIGDYSGDLFGGDGIVSVESADLKTFYASLPTETFSTNTFHTALTNRIQTNFEGFDEPDYYSLAYQIAPNTLYNGYVTLQGEDSPSAGIDYDDYAFTLPQDAWVSVSMGNIPLNELNLSIANQDYDFVLTDTTTFAQLDYQTDTIYLPAGTYYLEIAAYGNTQSWQTPYNFRLNYAPVALGNVSIADDKFTFDLFPNPTNNQLNINLNANEPLNGVLSISNQLGQTVFSQSLQNQSAEVLFDTQHLPKGIYFVQFINKKQLISKKLVVN
jgi:triacylglycerol esterase/lipase EstA (alpha/beta hydrolase family)